MNEMDRTLFDFDDEVDNLSEVSERYKANKLAIDSSHKMTMVIKENDD